GDVEGVANIDAAVTDLQELNRNPRGQTAAAFTGRSGSTRTTMNRNSGGQPQPPQLSRLNPAAIGGAQVANLGPNPAGQEVFQTEARFQTEGRPAAANPDGNRLNVNRIDNATGLVTESRDPNRQNAVIHKSYIKK